MNRREFLATAGCVVALAGCRSAAGGRIAARRGAAKFRLGMAGYTYKAYKTDAMLDEMQKLDVHNLCVKAFHLPLTATDAEIAEFKAKCASHGIVPYALGPIDMYTDEEAEAAFAFAKRFGAKLIVGVPVGFVNVVESKELIISSATPHIVARGRKGGSNVAAAIVNAMLYQIAR